MSLDDLRSLFNGANLVLEFCFSAAKIDPTSVWVRITGLNVVFNGESFHLSMASTLGTPIKIDMNSLNVVSVGLFPELKHT